MSEKKKDEEIVSNEPQYLDKEQLKAVIEEGINAQAEQQNITMTETIKGTVKELIEETIAKAVTPNKALQLESNEDPMGGFKSIGHFAADVFRAGRGGVNPSETLRAWNDQMLTRAAGDPSMNVTAPDEGGFFIPPEMSAEILKRVVERVDILSKAMVIPMSTNTIKIPFIKGFNESQGFVAGNVEFIWEQEEAQGNDKNVKIGMIQLNLRKAMALAHVSGDMMKFSPTSAGPLLSAAFTDAMTFALTRSFIRGSGAGQPLGVLNSNARVTVAKETGQAADTVVYENVLKMFSRMYGDGGEWYANRDVVPQLGAMNVSVGSGGAPVWINGGNAANALSSSLIGAPLEFTSAASALGDEGDIGFYNWGAYLVGQEAGGLSLDVATSIHLKFDYDQSSFRFIFYVDGQPWWPEPFSPEHGNTKSPFVTLAARA